MKIYLAGGVSGNLKPAWSRLTQMEITSSNFVKALKDESFLEGLNGRRHIPKIIHGGIFDKDADISSGHNVWQSEPRYGNQSRALQALGGGILSENELLNYKPFILESFYYADEETERLIPYFGDFLLDSGAFTFMQNATSDIVWEEYIERYADFVKRNNVEKFFELDIDPIVGYEKVKYYRQRLETLAGRPCIPVWHKSRGIDEFYKMCDEYSYSAIGGIVSGEITRDKYNLFPTMIREAHKRNCKLHGLGFTNLTYLQKCHFDSVDSTAWTAGNRFGYVYKFDGKTMRKVSAPSGKRLADSRKVALNNYVEWIKFQQYAERCL